MFSRVFGSFGARLRKDRKGNFSIMAALMLPVLIGLAGVSMDYMGLMNAKAKMRDASDAAALAASSALAQNGISENDARAVAIRYLKAHSQGDFDFYTRANIAIVTTQVNKAKTFKVTVNTAYDYPVSTMTAFTGVRIVPVVAKSTSLSTQEIIETKYPASLYLVLDRSGSMGFNTNEVIGKDPKGKPVYRIKIEALKVAISKMAATLKAVDPDWKYVRTGAVAFSTLSYPPVDLEWGTSAMENYANEMTANGFTNPVDALKTAHTSLVAASENSAHLAKNGGVPTKTILYMTDGENAPQSLDGPALANCAAAKAAGIEIYSIGFMVPNAVVPFLKGCATDSKHFFNASDAAALYAAFEKIGVSTSSKMANRVAE